MSDCEDSVVNCLGSISVVSGLVLGGWIRLETYDGGVGEWSAVDDVHQLSCTCVEAVVVQLFVF